MSLNTFSSKMSSYDFWAIFLPGVLWTGWAYCNGWLGCVVSGCLIGNCQICIPEIYSCILFGVISYLVGLINFVVCDYIGNKWKAWNDAPAFRKALKKYKENSSASEKRYCWEQWGKLLIDRRENENNCSMGTYYIAYYYAMQHTYCLDIRKMEIQIAFARSAVVPTVVIGLQTICVQGNSPCCDCLKVILWLVLGIGICYFIYKRQQKIFRLVIENYEYLK